MLEQVSLDLDPTEATIPAVEISRIYRMLSKVITLTCPNVGESFYDNHRFQICRGWTLESTPVLTKDV